MNCAPDLGNIFRTRGSRICGCWTRRQSILRTCFVETTVAEHPFAQVVMQSVPSTWNVVHSPKVGANGNGHINGHVTPKLNGNVKANGYSSCLFVEGCRDRSHHTRLLSSENPGQAYCLCSSHSLDLRMAHDVSSALKSRIVQHPKNLIIGYNDASAAPCRAL